MATAITWDIVELERETADGYVFIAHYTVNATDGTYKAGAYGSVSFERPETLIPYADLTKDELVGWVQWKLGGDEKVAEIEAALQSHIDEQAAPTKAKGLPWQS